MQLSTYQSYLFYTNNPTQSLARTAAEPIVSRAQQYYQANIGKVKTVDDFINNYRLFSYAMTAYGLQDFTYGKAFMKKVLESDLSDKNSFVNKLTDTRYKTFAEAFSFSTKGTVVDTTAVQSTDQENDTLGLYSQATASNPVSSAIETKYMQDNLGSVSSIDNLMQNTRLFGDVLTAYGIDPTTSATTIKAALESDLSDPSSFANQSGSNLAADMSAANLSSMSAAYAAQAGSDATSQAQAATETTYVTGVLSKATSLDTVVNDPRVTAYVGAAFGVPTIPAETLRLVLTSSLSDPKSVANELGSSYVKIASAFNFTTGGTLPNPLQKLAADFNFTSTGAVTNQRLAQTQANFSAMATAYTALAGTDATAKTAATAETTYVGTAISKATSLDGLLSDSRVVAYIGKAFGVPTISATTLRKVLTSDVSNPKSAANTLGPSYAKIAAAFDFTTTGTIAREPAQQAQSKANLAATNSGYLQQTMETEAGAGSAGVQLALYFQRKAPSITNAYSILADPALLKVAQTLLSLPSASSTTDIDLQAKRITEGINLKDFQDPAKLTKLVSRFAVLYDLNNPSSQQSDMVTLFGGSSSA